MKKILVAMLIACMMLSVASVALAAEVITNEAGLQTAFTNGGSYELGGNITLTAGLTLPAGKTLELDLKGYSISMEKACTEHFAMITNKGTMTIDDSVGGGALSFTDTGSGDPAYGWGSYTVRNEGTFTLENGSIKNKSTIAKGVSYALDVQGGSVTMNGGSVICDNKVAIRLFGKGTLTVNDGEITGTRAIWVHAPSSNPSNTPTMTVNVNGGTITRTNTDDLAIYVYSYGDSLENVTINITDGTVEGDIGLYNSVTSDATTGKVNISGGKLSDVYSYSDNQELAQEDITITGGEFTNDEYVGYYCDDDDHMCVVYGDGYIVIPVVTISFDANGGTGTMEDVTPEALEYTLPECGFTAPEGKQFKTWQADDGTEYAVGDVLTLTQSGEIKLTAVWEDIPAQAPAATPVPAAPAAPAPKTGDNTNIALWMALMAISAVALVGLRKKSKASK